eukprot:428431-Amphidinium_carterae.2
MSNVTRGWKEGGTLTIVEAKLTCSQLVCAPAKQKPLAASPTRLSPIVQLLSLRSFLVGVQNIIVKLIPSSLQEASTKIRVDAECWILSPEASTT